MGAAGTGFCSKNCSAHSNGIQIDAELPTELLMPDIRSPSALQALDTMGVGGEEWIL